MTGMRSPHLTSHEAEKVPSQTNGTDMGRRLDIDQTAGTPVLIAIFSIAVFHTGRKAFCESRLNTAAHVETVIVLVECGADARQADLCLVFGV